MYPLFTKIKEKFIAHPRQLGESYFKHLLFTFSMGACLLLALVILLLHGIFPFILNNVSSEMIDDIIWRFKIRSSSAKSK